MKKESAQRVKSAVLGSVFGIAYALIFSLGMACLLDLLGIAMGVAIDGGRVADRYPRFIPFCLCLGILALISVFILIFVNIRVGGKYSFGYRTVCLEAIWAFVLSVPFMGLWAELFAYLQRML